jgi:hypothetical protein
MPKPTSDPDCHGKGIPEHLHRLDRAPDPDFSGSELLFRRFTLGNEAMKAVIGFNRMSFNREKQGNGPDDALWNCEEGGRYDGCGVVELPVAALNLKWKHPTEQNTVYYLRPEHAPTNCNYPHTEVVVYKEENGEVSPQNEIKPTSVKARIREDLGKHLRVALPFERQGARLPL